MGSSSFILKAFLIFLSFLSCSIASTIHWEDIEEAIEQDKKLRKIRNALRMNDEDTLKEEIAGKIISDNWADPDEIVKSSSKILIEDLSLYRNCILVHCII